MKDRHNNGKTYAVIVRDYFSKSTLAIHLYDSFGQACADASLEAVFSEANITMETCYAKVVDHRNLKIESNNYVITNEDGVCIWRGNDYEEASALTEEYLKSHNKGNTKLYKLVEYNDVANGPRIMD
jgi:hypothetical protein